jgi:hypothetical protein
MPLRALPSSIRSRPQTGEKEIRAIVIAQIRGGCDSKFASLVSVFLRFIMVAGFMMGRRGMMVLSGLIMSLRSSGMML